MRWRPSTFAVGALLWALMMVVEVFFHLALDLDTPTTNFWRELYLTPAASSHGSTRKKMTIFVALVDTILPCLLTGAAFALLCWKRIKAYEGWIFGATIGVTLFALDYSYPKMVSYSFWWHEGRIAPAVLLGIVWCSLLTGMIASAGTFQSEPETSNLELEGIEIAYQLLRQEESRQGLQPSKDWKLVRHLEGEFEFNHARQTAIIDIRRRTATITKRPIREVT